MSLAGGVGRSALVKHTAMAPKRVRGVSFDFFGEDGPERANTSFAWNQGLS